MIECYILDAEHLYKRPLPSLLKLALSLQHGLHLKVLRTCWNDMYRTHLPVIFRQVYHFIFSIFSGIIIIVMEKSKTFATPQSQIDAD